MTISSVTAGTLITQDWGNSVADALNVGRYAKVQRTAQTVANSTNVTIGGMSAVTDPDGWGSSAGITVPTDGAYLFVAQIDWALGVASTRLISQIRAGGTTYAEDDRLSGSNTPNLSLSGTHYLAAGTLLSVLVFQASGASQNVSVALSAYRLQ